MERSVIRGLAFADEPSPDFASLHPGYAMNSSRGLRLGAAGQSRPREATVQRLVRHLRIQDPAHRDQPVEIDAGRKSLALAEEDEVLEHHIAGCAGRERAAAEAAERAVEHAGAFIEGGGSIRNTHAARVVQMHAD